jgi:hypothetical protein
MFNFNSMSRFELENLKRMAWLSEAQCDQLGHDEMAETMAKVWSDCVIELVSRDSEDSAA